MASQSKNNWIKNNPFGVVIGFVFGTLGFITAIDPPLKEGIGLIALYILGVLGLSSLLFSSVFFQAGWPIPHIFLLVLIGFLAGYPFDYLFMNMRRKRLLIAIVVFVIVNTLTAYLFIRLLNAAD
jgi:hypothetical protein